MDSFEADRAVELLRAADQLLDKPERLVVIGGMALALSHLQVFLPERHDLALMKLARGNEHDMQALEELHRALPFDVHALLDRFRETWVTGNRVDFELTFLAFIERVFGTPAAAALDGKL